MLSVMSWLRSGEGSFSWQLSVGSSNVDSPLRVQTVKGLPLDAQAFILTYLLTP